MTPDEHADEVARLPGKKPLRVGVVQMGTDRRVPAAFPEPPAAPGGAAPRPAADAVYADRLVLPDSVPADHVVDALQKLGAFTDVVPLPFDGRGVTSRASLVQRLQDRLWPTALAQELDAVLVIEGIADAGLTWSAADEGLVSLDTVLWWLAWPFGLWIPDRTYAPAVRLDATLFWTGDAAAKPRGIDLSAGVGAQRLHPWERAGTPLLGLVLPPALVSDDPNAVAAVVRDWTKAMLPVEVVREIKRNPLAEPGDVHVVLRTDGEHFAFAIDSAREVTEASLVALPRGALTGLENLTPRPLPLASQLTVAGGSARHASHGRVQRSEVEVSGAALLRLRLVFASGDQVSRTWAFADLAP